MNLQNIKKMKDEKGFTIVELLIVIVVIGILVAIVIVAYTGVTRTANNNKIKANAASLQKIAETVNANTGNYPTSAAEFTNTTDGVGTALPNGITINTLGASSPSLNTAAVVTAAKAGTFEVKFCAGGVNIFYPVDGAAASAAQQVVRAGATCP